MGPPPLPTFHQPTTQRAAIFVDGQNLYHCARECFGYSYPNYDVRKLAQLVCNKAGWVVSQIGFYTGFPDAQEDAMWNRFWNKKLLAISRQGIKVFSRPLRYREHVIKIGHGATITKRLGEEKGIDVRIALDVIRKAIRREYDVAVLFSQDQDLSEVADEIKHIALEQRRWLRIASAFPFSPTAGNVRGINKTDWIKIDRADYDMCVDPFDYRV